jgi:cardiolipin synthase
MTYLKNLKYLNLDKTYTSWVLSKTNIFKHVHPNYISIAGLLADFGILYFLSVAIFEPAIFLLVLRYHCDCLDGAVARKYNKVSNIGGLLDTIADNTLIYIVIYSIGIVLGISHIVFIALTVVILNVLYLIKNKAVIHHLNLKLGKDRFKNAYIFAMNNNMLLYSLIILILWLIY